MTSTNAPARFSRFDVELALQATNCPEWLAYRILAQLGGVTNDHGFGGRVARMFEAIFEGTRPVFASPNTYGGMAWDQAHRDLVAAARSCNDLVALWDALDAARERCATMTGFERQSYEYGVSICRGTVTVELGPRPAPPQPPPPPPHAVLVNPELHQRALEAVDEVDFPVLFERALMTLVRTWTMLPQDGDARVFALRQVGGWLRSLGAAAAADEVETLHFK